MGNYTTMFSLKNTCPIVKFELFYKESTGDMKTYSNSDISLDNNGNLKVSTADFFSKTLFLKITDNVGAFSTKQFQVTVCGTETMKLIDPRYENVVIQYR